MFCRQTQANKSGQPQSMSGSKEDVNVDPDSENFCDSQNDDNVNDHDEGGDVLIIGDSDNESYVDNEEEEAENVSQRSTIQEVLLFAFTFCSVKFEYVKDQILYGLSQAKDKVKKLKILLTPQLETTFLHNPKDSESNNVKWDSKELTFNKTNNWVPKSHSKKQPKRLPFQFNDPACKAFFTDDYLFSTGKKITLPTGVFSPNSVLIKESENKSCNYEFWGRQGILDSEITCYLLEFNKERIANVNDLLNELVINKQNKPTIDKIKKNMECIDHFNTLALQSNHRTKSWAIQTCVKARWELRSFVLSHFTGNDTIKENLLYSGFLSDELFGPLPKSVSESKPDSCTGKAAHLVSKFKPNNWGNNSTKRQTSNTNPPPKRSKFHDKPSYSGDWGNNSKSYYEQGPYGGSRNSEGVFHRGGKNNRKPRGRGKRGSK